MIQSPLKLTNLPERNEKEKPLYYPKCRHEHPGLTCPRLGVVLTTEALEKYKPKPKPPQPPKKEKQ